MPRSIVRAAASSIVVIGLIALGAILGLLVAAGSVIPPAVPALLGPAWCAVAVTCGLVVFRGVVAQVLGALGVLTGLWGIVALALGGHSLTAGALGIVSMLAVVTGGFFALMWGRRWPAFGRRYARAHKSPGPGVPASTITLWDALDRGEDPTRGEDLV